jgi:hypothetical protein
MKITVKGRGAATSYRAAVRANMFRKIRTVRYLRAGQR